MTNLDDWIIVNALGGLSNPNARQANSDAGQLVETSADLVIDERTITDARQSGVTAINITLGYTMGDFPPYAHTVDEIAAWDALIDRHPAELLKVRTAADIDRAKELGRVGIIYGFQNTDAIEGDPARIAQFARAGVRVIQLTYNQANAVGDGSMAPENRGLTALGHQVVEALNDAGVMVDLSHSGEQTCLDAIRASRAPISINHTGCRALVDLPRNKTDAELRLVADSGGFVGIYFMPFLDSRGHASAADVVNHIVHAVNVCGEDHVGIGTDGTITAHDDLDAYRATLAEHVAQRQAAGVSAAGERADTFPFVVDLRGVDQFAMLAELLADRGFSSSRIEKVLGRNFCDYAKAIWPA